MINPSREQVAVALFNLLQNIKGFQSWSRRPQVWSNSVNMPALFMGNPQEEYIYRHGTALPAEVTLSFDIFVYINAGEDPNVTPDTQLNTLLDAIEAALAPRPSGAPQATQTLGGIVNHCWIEGPIHRAPGYINGQGLALLTIQVLVPQ